MKTKYYLQTLILLALIGFSINATAVTNYVEDTINYYRDGENRGWDWDGAIKPEPFLDDIRWSDDMVRLSTEKLAQTVPSSDEPCNEGIFITYCMRSTFDELLNNITNTHNSPVYNNKYTAIGCSDGRISAETITLTKTTTTTTTVTDKIDIPGDGGAGTKTTTKTTKTVKTVDTNIVTVTVTNTGVTTNTKTLPTDTDTKTVIDSKITELLEAESTDVPKEDITTTVEGPTVETQTTTTYGTAAICAFKNTGTTDTSAYTWNRNTVVMHLPAVKVGNEYYRVRLYERANQNVEVRNYAVLHPDEAFGKIYHATYERGILTIPKLEVTEWEIGSYSTRINTYRAVFKDIGLLEFELLSLEPYTEDHYW